MFKMGLRRFSLLLSWLTLVSGGTGGALIAGSATDGRDRLFDADWRFLRADAPGAEAPGFDDSAWRALDLPHDWSIEDLTSLPESRAAELPVPAGPWRFQKGDDAVWRARDFDDSAWSTVTVPDAWERYPGNADGDGYGWFRRRIEIPVECMGRDFDLLLGRIDDADEAWLNGERIGGSGSFPPDFRSAWLERRRYRVPASLARGDGTDLLAVRVYDGGGNGGMYEIGAKTIRVGPFDPGLSESGASTGHVVGGIGWYRKYFALEPGDDGKRVVVRFDGVYMNSDLWINGHHAGDHPYGYTPFEFDLTPWLKPAGQPNVLAVRVRNEGKNTRWYSGSGIYRHCWLTVTEPIHVPTGGLFVTVPEISRDRALVKISGEVRNDGGAEAALEVRARIVDPRGKRVGETVSPTRAVAGATSVVEQSVELRSPRLWSLEDPALYGAEVEIVAAGKIVDRVSTRFGIRKIEVDAENGFRLNDQSLKLKGGCVHHDNGPLGAVAIDRAEERRVELLKANGFNAIRTAHNPPSTAFLEACDRLGMLVIDEAFDCWTVGKNGQDYSVYFKDWAERDIAAMLRRDRNHPSIVMWSIGNEIPDQFRAEPTQRMLRETVVANDTTRPVTQAICSDWSKGWNWEQSSDVGFKHIDIGGYNYHPEKYESDHARNPMRVIVGTESYPKNLYDYWSLVENHPYVIGDFVWTAMDYFGESGIGHATPGTEPDSFFMPWPWYNAWCGDLDVCGFKKPQSYYRDVVWRRSPIEMAVRVPLPEGVVERVSGWGWPSEVRSWNWSGHEGRTMQVVVYSRAERVRLALNGRTLGEKPVSGDSQLTVRFDVPYEPGELRAIGIAGGQPAGEVAFRTTGAPAAIRLTADRAKIRPDRNDLSYVTVEIVDKEGVVVPEAQVPVLLTVSGAGELAATGTTAPDDAVSFRAPLRKTYQGRCLAILRPLGIPGKITLRAEADGLRGATLAIRSAPSAEANPRSRAAVAPRLSD